MIKIAVDFRIVINSCGSGGKTMQTQHPINKDGQATASWTARTWSSLFPPPNPTDSAVPWKSRHRHKPRQAEQVWTADIGVQFAVIVYANKRFMKR